MMSFSYIVFTQIILGLRSLDLPRRKTVEFFVSVKIHEISGQVRIYNSACVSFWVAARKNNSSNSRSISAAQTCDEMPC